MDTKDDVEINEIMAPLTMAAHETEDGELAKTYLDAYLNFPTASNFDLVIERMRIYQTSWMHGRKR